MGEWKKERSRCWNLLLYPENNCHMDALDKIQSGGYDYVLVKHDMDSDELGELKKEHFHLIIKFPNAHENFALAKELGIEVNYIQKTKKFSDSALYLLHFGNPDKFQYSPDSLEGPLKSNVIKLLQGNIECESITTLLDWIESEKRHIGTAELMRKAVEYDMYSSFRRSGALFNNVLKEHNETYK